ncbi:hypothetical protein SBA4_2750011 [Candidatus Sulfopaludibacter sp. SbA4]|nr:hypothetical protein SBA4_2750011 [Candidatus Sulfopaludibacter sp. SbA4]
MISLTLPTAFSVNCTMRFKLLISSTALLLYTNRTASLRYFRCLDVAEGGLVAPRAIVQNGSILQMGDVWQVLETRIRGSASVAVYGNTDRRSDTPGIR